ncbi:hypothetical protein, partial [Listeria monocytogenes]|uniref:hypothetical protein n=1 Tax=Listeria monocytogenes TaxID=1639 RepID=UPI002FDBC43A
TNFTKLVEHSFTLAPVMHLPLILGNTVEDVNAWFTEVNKRGGVKLLGQLSSHYLLETGNNIPIMKELMYTGDPVNLSLK